MICSMLMVHMIFTLMLYWCSLFPVELAGLSVAEAVYDIAMDNGGDEKKMHALLVCG